MSARVWPPLLLLLLLEHHGAAQQESVVLLPGAFQNVSVGRNETLRAAVSTIPAAAAFVTLQFHTQRRRATLSRAQDPGPGQSVTGLDCGLLSPLLPDQTSLTLYLSSPDSLTVGGTAAVLPYSSTDPLPGACPSESSLDLDPNIHLQYNLYQTTVHFAPANLGHDRGEAPPPCDRPTGAASRWRLQYDVYQHFLPEGDLSERSLFLALQAAAAGGGGGVASPGRLMMTQQEPDMGTAVFSSAPGRGVVYSVVVRDPLLNTSASYVPAHTYACSFAAALDGCRTLGRISTKLFFTAAGLAGLFVCFVGHRFFKCELFCMGLSFTTFFLFVLLTTTTQLDYDVRLAVSGVVGVVGGVFLVMSWWRFGSVMACVVVIGLTLGFLVAAAVFFTPLGDLDVFRRSPAVFWVTFCCVMAVVPLLLVRWPREGNIVACGVVGAYAVVLAVNVYAATSLSYVALNVLRRLLDDGFSLALTDVPLQLADYGLIAVWVVLGVSGVVLQLYRERSRPFFPPSPYLMWLQERERRKTNVLDPSHHFPSLPGRVLARARQLTRRAEPAGEHTPLLL